MKWVESRGNSVRRWLYYLAMYTGLRAFLNRARSRSFALDPGIESLDGTCVSGEGIGELTLRVHSRSHPGAPATNGGYGLFSLQQRIPSVGRAAYRIVCRTSHYGCGHVEIAFFERMGEVTFYAVRNIARANASRIGLASLSRRLRLSKRCEDELVLRAVSRVLRNKGFKVRHAQPRECLSLAVDNRLLRNSASDLARNALYRKYDKLYAVIEDRRAG